MKNLAIQKSLITYYLRVKSFYFLAFGCCAMLYLTSCWGDRNCGPDFEVTYDIRNDLSEPLKVYHGYDTLVFKTETGILHTFISGPLDSGYNDFTYRHDDYCPTKEIMHKQYKRYFFYSNSYQNQIEYLVKETKEGDTFFHIIINRHDYCTSAILSGFNKIDSIDFNGVVYHQVLPIYRDYSFSSKELVYFTKADGIIKIIFDNGKTLTKVK